MTIPYDIKSDSVPIPLATTGTIVLNVLPFWEPPYVVAQDPATGIAYLSAAGEATDANADATVRVSQSFFVAAVGDDVDISAIGAAIGSWSDASLGILTIYAPPPS